MINPLYQFFERTGCSFCPYMKKRAFYVIWKNYKETWDYMKNIENRLQKMSDVANDQWRINETLEILGKEFENGLHRFNDNAPQSCECKLTLFDDDYFIQ